MIKTWRASSRSAETTRIAPPWHPIAARNARVRRSVPAPRSRACRTAERQIIGSASGLGYVLFTVTSQSQHVGPQAPAQARPSKGKSGLEVAFAYLVACSAQIGIVLAWSQADPTVHPLLNMFVSHVAATLVIFAFSFVRNNSSFFDAYWSVIPMTTVVWLAWMGFERGTLPPARAALVITLVWAWGARLTFNWWRGWTGLDHEDWRYVEFRHKFPRLYWLVSLSGIHLFPCILVFAGCASLWPALVTGDAPLGWLDAVAAVVTAGAIVIEATADQQLWRWRQSEHPPEAYMRTGLWSWSRHPNYFGETSFWWGLFLFAIAAHPGSWWAITGPGLMTALFVFISIPMMEKRTLAKRPHYADHIAKTSMFVPLPPRT